MIFSCRHHSLTYYGSKYPNQTQYSRKRAMVVDGFMAICADMYGHSF